MGFRAPKVNWEQQIENILDIYDLVYELPGVNKLTAITHAVQKDAIQNSIDAEDIKNQDNWSIEFKSQKDNKGNEFITITDTGTFGLTGKADIEDEELLSLNLEEQLKERWARFESLAYKNPDEKAIGARGQGKFIFIGNSKDKEMIYETLREDGIHRVGHWITKGRGGKTLIDPLEGDKAIEYLKEKISLVPLKKIGTRIIIINPKEGLVESFKPIKPSPPNKCDLAKYISETWWELLFDKNKKIFISLKLPEWSKAEKIIVSPPELYRKFKERPESFKSRIMENKRIQGVIRVKEFVIGFSEEEIPPELRGISIQRGGMKIALFDIRDGNEHIKEKYKKHIFGWIILNEEGEKELRKKENPHHYGLKKTVGSLAQEIFSPRGWLSKEVRKFAEEELGIVPGEKKKINLGKIQTEVISYLNKLAKSFGYNTTIDKGGGKNGGGKRGETNPIRIQMPSLDFPGSTRRVEFGERISGVKVKAMNDTKRKIFIKLELSLESSSKARKLNPRIKTLLSKKLYIPQNNASEWYGPYSILFSKKNFKPGRYTLKAELTSLENKGKIEKGHIYHKITRAIYLAENPKAVGKLRDIRYEEFSEENKKLRYRVEEENKGLVIFINFSHPSYEIFDKLNEIAQRSKEEVVNPLHYYLIEIGIQALLTEDMYSEAKFLGENSKKFLGLLKNDIDGLHEKTLSYRDKIPQRMLFEAYKK